MDHDKTAVLQQIGTINNTTDHFGSALLNWCHAQGGNLSIQYNMICQCATKNYQCNPVGILRLYTGLSMQ